MSSPKPLYNHTPPTRTRTRFYKSMTDVLRDHWLTHGKAPAVLHFDGCVQLTFKKPFIIQKINLTKLEYEELSNTKYLTDAD